MSSNLQDMSRKAILHRCERATFHLIHLHAELIYAGEQHADEWIEHMIAALSIIAEYYSQDVWE